MEESTIVEGTYLMGKFPRSVRNKESSEICMEKLYLKMFLLVVLVVSGSTHSTNNAFLVCFYSSSTWGLSCWNEGPRDIWRQRRNRRLLQCRRGEYNPTGSQKLYHPLGVVSLASLDWKLVPFLLNRNGIGTGKYIQHLLVFAKNFPEKQA